MGGDSELEVLSSEELQQRSDFILSIYNKHRSKHKTLGPLQFIGQDPLRPHDATSVENAQVKSASNKAVRALNSSASLAKRNSYDLQEEIGHFVVYVMINGRERYQGNYTQLGLERAKLGFELLGVAYRVENSD